jgi:uncharacterized membrane-anchored protein
MAQAAGRPFLRLLAVAAFLAVLLGGFALWLGWPLLAGTTVVLDTRPVDPFDPLRGQYVVIGYEIGSLPAVPETEEGSAVYVEVAPDADGVWRHRATHPAPPDEGVFLRGDVVRAGPERMEVRYGIEQYFFERGSEVPARGLTVEVKADRRGRARIVRLLHEGEPLDL